MPRCFQIGVTVLAIAMVSSMMGLGGDAVVAQPGKKTQRRSTQPAAKAPSGPDATATVPQVEKPKAPAAPGLGTEEKLPPPFNLPTASRARMRACGEAWQGMKMSGRTGDQTWRAYATKCLASKDGPEKASP